MSFKPSDFFLGVVSFLGVLVPGAVFVFLLLSQLPPQPWVQRPNWIAFAVAAYILGCLLLAASEILNLTVDWLSKGLLPRFYTKLQEVEADFRQKHHDLMCPETAGKKVEGDLKDRGLRFHTALSYVRLRNAEAAAEVDHHMADYKLLRGLVAVLLVSVAISLGVAPRNFSLLVLESGLAALAFLCFVRMYNWARFLAFDYALQLSRLSVPPDKK